MRIAYAQQLKCGVGCLRAVKTLRLRFSALRRFAYGDNALITILTLFSSALLAATLFPAQSEGLLAYYVIQGEYTPAVLVAVATLGNVVGSLINYGMGWFAAGTTWARKFGPSERQLNRAREFYQSYGRWSLLFSWMPIIGDPLTLIAGMMKERLSIFLLLVTAAKISRYMVVALLASHYA